jgi:hypothetical protein
VRPAGSTVRAVITGMCGSKWMAERGCEWWNDSWRTDGEGYAGVVIQDDASEEVHITIGVVWDLTSADMAMKC